MAKRYTHKNRLNKRRRGGTVPFTPNKSFRNQQFLSPQTPIKATKRTPLKRTNGMSVRNLREIFEEKALQPSEITYGHTQNNKPNTARQSLNQINNIKNIKHSIVSKIQNTVKQTNKLRPEKQLATLTQTRKNNRYISKLNFQPKTLKQLPQSQLKTAQQYTNNNIERLSNIWISENVQA